MRSRLSLAAASFALSLLAALAMAQDEEEKPLFVERFDVTVINVEVFVSGEHSQGLTAEDFELYEDGVPVEISNFYASERIDRATGDFDADRRLVEGGAAPDPATPSAEAERTVPEDQRLSLVVYVDNLNLRPDTRRQVLQELGPFLEDRLFQGDRVMLIAHGGKLEVVQNFTRDMKEVTDAIARISEMAAYRPNDDAKRRNVERMIFISGDNPTTESDRATARINGLESIRFYAQERRAESERSLAALKSTLRQLGGLVGRKAMLYVSDGIERRPAQSLYQLYSDYFGNEVSNRYNAQSEIARNDLGELLGEVGREANANQVTFYAVHARGPGGLGRADADKTSLAATSTLAGSLNTDMIDHSSSQEAITSLAATTGGTAILNTRNFGGALTALSRDFDSLYSLGYSSRHGGDGKFHRVEVKVKRPGLKIRYRTGYVDKDQQARIADRTVSAMLFEQEKNPGGIMVDFMTPREVSRSRWRVSLLVRIPFDKITLLPDGSRLKGKLRIFLAVKDDIGMSDIQQMDFPVDIASRDLPKARGKELGHAAHLEIREGQSLVAIGVWDEVSGIESYLQKNVQLDDPKKADVKRPRR